MAELKAIRRRPGEGYMDFFDRLNTAAARVYATDEEYRKSYVKMEFYLQLGSSAKQFVRVHTDGTQEDCNMHVQSPSITRDCMLMIQQFQLPRFRWKHVVQSHTLSPTQEKMILPLSKPR